MDKPEIIVDYKWIAVHTYSGYENKVAENILKVADGRGMRDQIVETCVPKETVISTKIRKEKLKGPDGKICKDSEGKAIVQEIKEDKEKVVVKYPSYVFVKVGVVDKSDEEKSEGAEEKMLTDVAWYIIRNTRGVTGFIGPNKKPSALSREDVEQFGLEATAEETVEEKVYDIDYAVGDTVEIVFGEFKGLTGKVTSIDFENRRVVLYGAFILGAMQNLELALGDVTLAE